MRGRHFEVKITFRILATLVLTTIHFKKEPTYPQEFSLSVERKTKKKFFEVQNFF